MRKLLLAVSVLASLAFSVPMAYAENHEGIHAQTITVSAYHANDLMPALPVIEATTEFNTTARYALNDINVTMPAKLVSRDFRTIADSGGA